MGWITNPFSTTGPYRMRVRCIAGKGSWVKIGAEYDVIGIFGRSNSIKYRIISEDNNTPVLLESEIFDIISPKIPINWIFRIHLSGGWEIIPTDLSNKGFWVAFFDGEKEAVSTLNNFLAELNHETTSNAENVHIESINLLR